MIKSGLIDRAFLSGTNDPSLYLRKFPRINWPEAGGYRMETTPNEAAAIVTQSRPWVKGHRMLCVGTGTLGAERFLAENLGILEVEYIGEALESNALALKANKVTEPSGKYDVVTVFGTAKVDAILKFTKIGSLVVFIGIGPIAKNPALRTAWLGIRKKHMTMLQTGGQHWETGVGVIKILFVEGQDAVRIESTKSVDVPERAGNGEAVGSGNPEGGQAPEAGEEAQTGEAGTDDQKAVVIGMANLVNGDIRLNSGELIKGPKPWSRAHEKCVECGTTEKKHVSKGLCQTCYPKRK